MSEQPTRRDVLKTAVRGSGALVLGGTVFYLTTKAGAEGTWYVEPSKCINIRLGETGRDACTLCSTSCVLPLSAIRAVNEFAECGRCCICPAYYDVTSETGKDGLPTKSLCPRDAIERKAIGFVDPDDPLNNFYEYTIDDKLCDGCGRCVMACKEPAGLGSIRLEVRYDLCLDCNRCTIAQVCPDDAMVREEDTSTWKNLHASS